MEEVLKKEISLSKIMGEAFAQMKRILFKPFRFKKWLKFGFIVFIAEIFSKGFRNNFDLQGFLREPEGKQFILAIVAFCKTHLPLVIGMGIALVIISIILYFLFLYLSSVFSFVFLDGVVKNKVEIRKSFRENKQRGFSYFLFNILFGFACLLLIFLIDILPLYLIIKNKFFEQSGFLSIFLVVAGWAVVSLIHLLLIAVIAFFVEDFVLPIMYKQNLRFKQAWCKFWPIFKSRQKNFFLYLLLKFGLSIVGAIFAGIVLIIPLIILGLILSGLFYLAAATSIGSIEINWAWLLIPFVIVFTTFSLFAGYISICLTLPIPVFFRCFSLVFLGKCDEKYLLLKSSKENCSEINTKEGRRK